MKRDKGFANVSALFTLVGLMGLDLVAIRIGLGRTQRLLHAVWAAVPETSTLGLALSALSLLALAVTMTWRRLRLRAEERDLATQRAMRPTTPRATRLPRIGGNTLRMALVVAGLASLAAVSGCATTTARAHSPTALCSDLTLDHRSLYCANDLPHTTALR